MNVGMYSVSNIANKTFYMFSATAASEVLRHRSSCSTSYILRNAAPLSNSITMSTSVCLRKKNHLKPVIYVTLMMKPVVQDGGPPPLCYRRPLRLISSFTQTQSGDIIHQLFPTNYTPNKIKSISSETRALLEASII